MCIATTHPIAVATAIAMATTRIPTAMNTQTHAVRRDQMVTAQIRIATTTLIVAQLLILTVVIQIPTVISIQTLVLQATLMEAQQIPIAINIRIVVPHLLTVAAVATTVITVTVTTKLSFFDKGLQGDKFFYHLVGGRT